MNTLLIRIILSGVTGATGSGHGLAPGTYNVIQDGTGLQVQDNSGADVILVVS